VNLKRNVQDELGIRYMKIDVSKNTHEGTIVLWVAQRNHQFTSWWITYTMV